MVVDVGKGDAITVPNGAKDSAVSGMACTVILGDEIDPSILFCLECQAA